MGRAARERAGAALAGYSGLSRGCAFGSLAWRALNHERLRVLAFDATFSGGNTFRGGGPDWLAAMGPHMAPAITQRLPSLRNLRVMPDFKGASRVSMHPYKVTPYPKPKPLPAYDFW